jgi:hypothetical protein
MNERDKKNTDKIIRLVEYLTALARINAKIVRTLDNYRKVLWIHDIPHEPKYCFTQAWGQEEEQDNSVWIEIKKVPEPELPKIPPKCTDWVKWETLRDTKELPDLHDAIIVERTEKDPETGKQSTRSDTIYLAHYSDIQQTWEDYLGKQWMPWTERYNRYARIQKFYTSLFHIYQEQQKLGEQYELVFCKGLLNWKPPSGHEARRHVIIAKASLEFEHHLGKFTVKQAVFRLSVMVISGMVPMHTLPTGLIISHWLSARFTVEFMGIWKKMHNPDFNVTEFRNIRNESGSNNFVRMDLKNENQGTSDPDLTW